METTRDVILSILRRRSATVEGLTTELGLAPATIRRHLDILSRDGLLDVTQVRRRTGRPHYLFSLSETGKDLFPKHYVRLTNRLIEEIVALKPEETSGRGGGDLANLVFEKMAQRLAQRIAPRVHGSSLAQRVHAAAEALVEEGIAFDVEEGGDGFLLVGRGCPCPRAGVGNGAAPPARQACAHDQRLLSLLLSAEVTYVEPGAVSQDGSCAYRVQERQSEGRAADKALPPAKALV